MKIFDINEMASDTHERISNVFYNVDEFKARIIELPPDEEIPVCEMTSYVLFYIVKGSVDITVNQEKATLTEGQCLISEPATISMKTIGGALIIGIQTNVGSGM